MRSRSAQRRRSAQHEPITDASARVDPSARVLDLQKSAGNAAIARELARQPRAQASTNFRVLLVEPTATRLTQGTRDAALATVRAELNRVTQRSRVRSVRAGMTVTMRQGELPEGEPADIGAGTWVCYLVGRASADSVTSLARRHLNFPAREEPAIREHIARQLGRGGVTVHWAGRSVSIATTFLFESDSLGTLPARDRRPLERAFGARLGELILHELGHGMDAEHHEEGIMEATRTVQLTDPHTQRFSQHSAEEIRARLEGLAARR